MTFLEKLKTGAERVGNILCLGLDPVPERVARAVGSPELGAAEDFLESILSALQDAGLLPSALKPNLAYFEQYGPEGLGLLTRLIERWSEHCLIICDAKRGDIGRSSLAYARTFFEYYKADALTVSPWMGKDSLEPFLDYGPQHGTYALLRTSNPGHGDIQAAVWERLAVDFKDWGGPHLGAVVGATSVADLGRALELLGSRPLLIPGVGTQGGSAKDVLACLRAAGDPWMHRVNVSSGILYAEPNGDYLSGAVRATEKFASQLQA